MAASPSSHAQSWQLSEVVGDGKIYAHETSVRAIKIRPLKAWAAYFCASVLPSRATPPYKFGSCKLLGSFEWKSCHRASGRAQQCKLRGHARGRITVAVGSLDAVKVECVRFWNRMVGRTFSRSQNEVI
jgi:hypothetical protein